STKTQKESPTLSKGPVLSFKPRKGPNKDLAKYCDSNSDSTTSASHHPSIRFKHQDPTNEE
ncbi:12846_t:CDS:1, partial [Gigaspora rosea]